MSPVHVPVLAAAMLCVWPSILCSALSSGPFANASAATTSDSIAKNEMRRFIGESSSWNRPGASGTAARSGVCYGSPPRAGLGPVLVLAPALARRGERDQVNSRYLRYNGAVNPPPPPHPPPPPAAPAPQRLAGHVDDRQPEVFDRGDARRRRQRVTLAREVVLELVQGPREERVHLPDELHLAPLQEVGRVVGGGRHELAHRATVASEPEVQLALHDEIVRDARLGGGVAPDIPEQLAHGEEVAQERARVVRGRRPPAAGASGGG